MGQPITGSSSMFFSEVLFSIHLIFLFQFYFYFYSKENNHIISFQPITWPHQRNLFILGHTLTPNILGLIGKFCWIQTAEPNDGEF